jgi:peptidoglycan/LPS O-acetylase OafA/YrhL
MNGVLVLQFRKDINGLRAIAVFAVVLFHFNASWMPGGFAGVDVFFVISGFLMTGIIFRGIEQENFLILKFYVARANRIIPALAVLCLVLLVFGWFYLTPLDYRALGKHVGGSMVFLSNFMYWGEAGYFDAGSHEKWLLHTWSLSAEWQFYIIYPLVLVAMRKFMSVKAMKATVLFGTLLSFIFCVIASYKMPEASYYLLPTRAWEMMVGGVAYLYPIALKKGRKKLFEWFGLVLIIGSYFLISKENLWPGYLALFPVLGSFLIIQAQRNDSFITSNIVSQKIGAWSYSIYLWHWPLVVAIYYFSLSDMWIYIGIVSSVFLGFISNKYIESTKYKPVTSNHYKYFFKTKPIVFSFTLCVVSFFVYIYGYNYTGVSKDVKIRSSLVNKEKNIRQIGIRAGICNFNERGNYNKLNDFIDNWDCDSDDEGLVDSRILIFGDSHSADKAMGFRFNGIDVIQIGGAGCPLEPYMAEQSNDHCLKIFNFADQNIFTDSYDYILLSSVFGMNDLNEPSYLENVIKFWSKKEKEIIIFSPMPNFERQMNEYLRFDKITKKPTLIAHNKFFELLKEIDLPNNVHIINTYNVWCEKNIPCKVENEDELLLVDGGHFTALGANYFVKTLLKNPIFNEIIKFEMDQ